MWDNIRTWLRNVELDDPIDRRQAVMVQVMLLGLLVAVIPAVVLTLSGRGVTLLGIRVLALVLVGVVAVVGLALVRRGRFRAGVLTAVLGMLASLSILAVLGGVISKPSVVMAMGLPVVMAGLLLDRRALIAVGGLSVVAVAAAAYYESVYGPVTGASQAGSWLSAVNAFVVILVLMGVFFDRFSSSLRSALVESLARERELEELRGSLEAAVASRTAELQATVDRLQASQATIRELGAPVLPVLPGVLVAPLIGAIDSGRAADLSEAVLRAIDRTRARSVILDITGVPVVDTQVARALLAVAQAARLLGAESLLVGVSAEVAQTIVTLGVDLGAISVYPNLQEAVGGLLAAPRARAS